jgi:hypothetical protein
MRSSLGGRGDGAGIVGAGLAMVQNLLDVASRRNVAASNAARQLHGRAHADRSWVTRNALATWEVERTERSVAVPPLHLVVALVGPIGPVLLRECGGALRVRVCSDDRSDCEHSAHHLHGTTERSDSHQQQRQQSCDSCQNLFSGGLSYAWPRSRSQEVLQHASSESA